MVEMNAINHKGWLTWLGKALLAVAIIMILSTIHGSSAMALSNVGPSSPGDRYNLTKHTTHPYTELEVPVYFKDKPDSDVGVQVFDAPWGDSNNGAIFNGGVRIHGEDHFTINAGDFWYDSSTGYWKAMVRAYLIGNIFQFKLRLDRGDGIIAYATGRASQASIWYNDNMGDINGHERKEMQMALPCSITKPTEIGPNTLYPLKLYDLDSWYPEWDEIKKHNNKWWHNNGMQPLYVSVLDETTGETVAYYSGEDPKYQCGGKAKKEYGPTCMGEHGALNIKMTMYPDHKYKIIIDNAWKNNLIEYELPFDNIFYNISCEPKVDMRTTVDFTKKPTGDPEKQPRTGYKWLSSYGKYNSKENDKSIAEVMGYTGANKPNTPNKLWTWTGNYSHDQIDIGRLPKAVMDNNHHKAELYPGDELTWWFRAYNSDGYIVPKEMKMDFANLREGWIDSRPPGWNWNQTEPKPEEGSNWFQPADRGGPLNGSDHRQIMWGCYDWGEKCYDNVLSFNRRISKEGEAVTRHYRYVVKPGDAGQTLCQWLRMSWEYNGWKQRLTPKACVYIPYHYPVKPPKQPPPGGGDKDNSGVVPTAWEKHGKSKVQAGDDVQFKYSLTNTSGPTVSRQIEYRSYTFILKKEAKLPLNAGQKPYHYAEKWKWGGGKGVGCGGRDIDPGAQVRCEQGVGDVSKRIYPGQTWPVLGEPKYNVSGIWLAQPGDKICSYIAIDNNWSVKNDQSADTFRASNIACVVVTKSPNLNLSGSDSYAKDGFTGSDVRENIVPGTDKRGSYSQYGLLTGDKNGVTSFGSAGYTTASQANHGLACKLSYANTGSVKDDCKDLSGLQPAGLIKPDNGKLSTPKWPTSFKSQLASQVSIDPPLASGDYSRNGSLTITGGSLSKGQHVRLFVKGDVTIDGDISVDEVNPIHSSLSDIPSLTVVATGDIRVKHGVSVIAGTYVAGGKFESCKGAQNKSADLGMRPDSKCQSKLKVNGAVVSEKSPFFLRTFGAGNRPEDDQWKTDKISSTAEWIDYTPNLWLTTSNGSSGNQLEGLTTTQVTNLPVRY